MKKRLSKRIMRRLGCLLALISQGAYCGAQMPRSIQWEELSADEIQKRIREKPFVLLPIGAIEWHGPQNAVGLDYQIVMNPVEDAARELGVLRAPPVYWGGDSPEGRLPGSLIVRKETIENLLVDIIESLKAQGVRGVLGVSGHGAGGHLEALGAVNARYQHDQDIDVQLFPTPVLVNFARMNPENLLIMDHAGAAETSMQMVSAPGRVHMDALPKEGMEALFGFIGKDPRTDASKLHGEKLQEVIRQAIVANATNMLGKIGRKEPVSYPPASVSGKIRAKPAPQPEKEYLLLYSQRVGFRSFEIPKEGVATYRFDKLVPGTYSIIRWGLTSLREESPYSQLGDYHTFTLRAGEQKSIDLAP